jgi:hypothetical protein
MMFRASIILTLGSCAFLPGNSGRVLLCVLPTHGPEGLHSVKWHPKEENTLAIASESNVYIINVLDADRAFGQDTIDQAELARICRPMRMPSVRDLFL